MFFFPVHQKMLAFDFLPFLSMNSSDTLVIFSNFLVEDMTV